MEQKPEKAPAAPASFDTIEGTLQRFTFRNEDTGFAVVRFAPDAGGSAIAVVGQLAQLTEGQKLRVSGPIVEHPRFGRQLEAQTVEAVLPTSVEGIRSYLASSLVKGIGPVTAAKITDRFGADTLRVIEEQPQRLREVRGLGAKRIEELVAAVQSQHDVQDVMVFLRAHGLGQALATRIVRHYGKGAAARIQADPYRLADDVIGIGFQTADRLARELGIGRDAPARIRAGTLHVLSQAAREGHCLLPRVELCDRSAALLSLEAGAIDSLVTDLVAQGRVRIDTLDHGGPVVYPTALHMAEQGVAERLGALVARPPRPIDLDADAALSLFERSSGMHLPAGQRQAVRLALSRPVSVITGGPGVGKTSVIRALARILADHGRHLRLAAPTGRAAKRLEESTGSPASTIHRLLEWQPGVNRFLRDDCTPIDGDLLVVDEASMLDVQLCYNLLRAIPHRMQLVLVGDANQLPSVGPGQVLGDILASQLVPVTELTEIFRQHSESQIVANAHALLRGEEPRTGGEDGDFFFIESRDSEHTHELIGELVATRIPRKFGLDPIRDVQVLCPMYRGHAGADRINHSLQDLLNPGEAPLRRAGRSFRVGDKVMQIRNDYDLDLFNGDTGRIVGIDEAISAMAVRFGDRVVSCPFADLDSLVPAYAITVHRSQGSEYPAVVMPLATDHYMMLRRNLLYTAITRGRQLVVLVGSRKALGMAVRNDEEARRWSGLAWRLRTAAAHRGRAASS